MEWSKRETKIDAGEERTLEEWVHSPIYNTDHVLGHKTSLNKFSKDWNEQNMFFNHNVKDN